MLSLILLIVLVLLLVGALPSWPYSRSWGYAPSGLLTLVAGPEQRAAIQEVGGLMSLLEGHGDVTMDRATVEYPPGAQWCLRAIVGAMRFAECDTWRRAA